MTNPIGRRRFDPAKMAAKQAAQKQRQERRNVPMNELGNMVETAPGYRQFLITSGLVNIGIGEVNQVYQATIEAYNLVGIQPRPCTAMDKVEKHSIIRALEMFFRESEPSDQTSPAA